MCMHQYAHEHTHEYTSKIYTTETYKCTLTNKYTNKTQNIKICVVHTHKYMLVYKDTYIST